MKEVFFVEFIGMRRLLSHVRRCVDDYNMIAEGDKIAVGVSGGKDSLTLLAALHDLAIFYPNHFTLCAITVDMGFEGADFSEIRTFCENLGIEYRVIPSDLGNLLFNIRKEKNPCSLCAKMRRGMLNEAAKEAGCNKVALGHHFDDLVETFMLNLIHEGRIGAFLPVTYLDRTDITVIRPMALVPEKYVRYFTSKNTLPVYTNPCPADKHTERETAKQLVADLERAHKGFKHRVFGAMQKADVDGWKVKNNDEK